MKTRFFVLRRLIGVSEHFARRSEIKPRARRSFLHGGEHVMSAVDVRSYRRELVFEIVAYETLRRQAINLIRLHFVHDITNAGEALQRRCVQNKLVKDLPYTPKPVLRILDRNSPNYAMHLIALV